MNIYTKTGDKGTTSLANGNRVAKNDLRLEAYGTSDELNSFVGLLRCKVDDQEVDNQLNWIQNKLFNLGAALSLADGEWIDENDVRQLEIWMDEIQEKLTPLRGFILPGGNEVIALCHVCRTITRRMERLLCAMSENMQFCEYDKTKYCIIMQYVNRLSDFFFLLAKKIADEKKIELFLWKK